MQKLISHPFSTLMRSLAVGCVALSLALPAAAQNLFAPAARVNDVVVTEFEVAQRQRFLQLLRAPGSDRKSALDALIEDRLQQGHMRSLGLEVPEDSLREGLAQFASRAELSTEEFVTALGQAGVDRETFRDFVAIQIGWRNFIRARYGNRVNISDQDIDNELSRSNDGTGLRVLLSEIIIPAPPQNAARVAALADQIAQTRSTSEFSSYARRYSATASRGRGGQMPWTPIENLPPALVPVLLGLAIGEVTSPLNIPNAVALFQLRGIEETGKPKQTYSEIEYAAYYIAGGRSEAGLAEAAKVRARVDNCDDLYGIAQGQPAEVLERGAKKPGEIPQDIAIELAKLDPGESSVALTRSSGQTLVFLMLCKRVAEANAEIERDAVVNAIRQRILQGYSQQLVEQLRADARISRL